MSVDSGVRAAAPMIRRVRAYFAPVDRITGATAVFDPAQMGGFGVDSPVPGWLDLGWVHGFKRSSGTKVDAVKTGAPAVAQMQVRSEIEALVSLQFETWGKLQIALSAGTQQMNLLRTAVGAAAGISGGAAVAATPLLAGSTASALQVGAAAAGFEAGDLIVVDADYTGQTGWLGAGVSGAYVRSPLADVHYVRRVSLNVARVSEVVAGTLTLEDPLPAGAPTTAMKVGAVVGFCDRDGSSFFQEWSGLFVLEGQQGERIVLHYPRLQASAAAAEAPAAEAGLESLRLAGTFRALPVKDPVDGETVVCFRSFLPA